MTQQLSRPAVLPVWAESGDKVQPSNPEIQLGWPQTHTMSSLGVVFEPNKRPWKINFYGSISALEAEKQSTRANAMNAGMMLVQAMQQMKELGASEAVMREFLAKTMMLDEEQANLFATLVKAQPEGMTGEAEEY